MQLGRLNVGTPDEPLEADHVIPLSRGGTDANDNLQTLCKTHHSQKTAAEKRRQVWRIKGCRADGSPLDPNSDWYKPAVYRPYQDDE